jgi:hypothetical protein
MKVNLPFMVGTYNDRHALVIRCEIEPLDYGQALMKRPFVHGIQGLRIQTPLTKSLENQCPMISSGKSHDIADFFFWRISDLRIARDRGGGDGGVHSRWHH